MRSTTALKKLKPLLKKPSFTAGEARERGVSSATIAYYVKRGDLRRIGHGVYRADAFQPPSDFRHRAAPATKVVRMRNTTLGRTKTKIGSVWIPIFDRERTIVDAFRYLGRETAIKALKAALSGRGADRVDLEKLRQYAKALRVQIEPYLLAVPA
jgi:predicted transcriptional regulator of viral defense system